MRWLSGVAFGAALTTGATRLRRALLTPTSVPTVARSRNPAPVERSTSITASGGRSQAPVAESAAAAASSVPMRAHAARSAASAPLAREDTLDLLEGIATTLIAEAESADDLEVGLRLHLLTADVLDAIDDLAAS